MRRVKREEKGGEPVHWDKVNIKKSTYSKKLAIKRNWYKKENKGYRIRKWGNKVISDKKMGCTSDPPNALIFLPKTPRGVLARRIKEIEANLNKVGMRKVKVVEEGGRQIQDMLVIKNPLGERLCDKLDCQVCQFSNSKGGAGVDQLFIQAPAQLVR